MLDKWFKLEIVGLFNDPLEALKRIGLATLKVEWKKRKKLDFRVQGGGFHTWILGLPRNVKKTGYFINSEKGRRISSIGFSLFQLKNQYAVIMYGFQTFDWARKLSYLIHKPRGISVLEIAKSKPKPGEFGKGIEFLDKSIYAKTNIEVVNEAFNAAWNFLKAIISGGKI